MTDEQPTPDERYRQAMAAYPKCACGQSLWAPQSQERGYCEACRLRRKRADCATPTNHEEE